MNIVLALVCASVVAAGCEKTSPETAPTAAKPTTSTATAPTAAPAGAPLAATNAAISLVPKASFGPIGLGASKADIEVMGILKTHPQYSGMTIPYTVYYDAAGKAKRIQLSLMYAASDVTVGNVTIPRSASMDDVKKLLGDCVDEPPAEGGTTSKCRGGTVNVSIGSGNAAEVWLEAALP
jgi:hypothetical protein